MPHEHNYVTKLAGLIHSGKIKVRGVHDVIIKHDDWCDLLTKGQRCNCDPDISAVNLRPLGQKPGLN